MRAPVSKIQALTGAEAADFAVQAAGAAAMAVLTLDAMLPDMATKKAPFALVLLGTHSGRDLEKSARVGPREQRIWTLRLISRLRGRVCAVEDDGWCRRAGPWLDVDEIISLWSGQA